MATTRELVADTVRELFTEKRADQIIQDEAFGALVWRVKERLCYCDHPSCVFEMLDEDDMEFAADGADNPAAYLAARVRDM